MGLRSRILVFATLLLIVAGVAAFYFQRETFARQWMLYKIGAAPSYEAARPLIAEFESEPDRELRLRDLVRKWGTGNREFDLYLAQYVGDTASSESLREAFSLNLSWQEDRLTRWAHYWSWRPAAEPDRRMRSLLDHLDLLLAADPSSATLTWREILDLQAVLTLTGQSHLALRLSPENWRERYRQWLASRPEKLPTIAHPANPLPEE